MQRNNDEIVDLVGVGFGPSNLGLAIAIGEHNDRADEYEQISARFIEKQSHFAWHPGMLLPGTTMQVSFLKDLVTQRNVRSRFTFLNYLVERERLTHFINHQSFFPSRLEFHDYLEWAAETVGADVAYGAEATAVSWNGEHFEVSVAGTTAVRARNVVLAGGLSATMPEGLKQTRRVFHNHGLLDHLGELPAGTPRSFVVVGAGQSAAEVAAHLHETYPDAHVHGVFGKYGYSPADDSPYANRIFDPEAVDDFYQSSPQLREQLISYHRGTNYSAVDLPLIEELYRREYTERVTGHRRLFIHGASEIVNQIETNDAVTVGIRHRPTGRIENVVCDAVVCATGFRPLDLHALLGRLADECIFDDTGRPSVTRDYRLETTDRVAGAIYLQGGTEHSHGLTSSLLSNIAVRSGELVESLVVHKTSSVVLNR